MCNLILGVPTVFVHQLSYDATFSSTVTLQCTVSTTTSATITDVFWQKKNECQTKNISSSTRPAKYSGGTVNTPSLTIFNADGLDVSSYTCFASNIAGTGQSSASFLNVSEGKISSLWKYYYSWVLICVVRTKGICSWVLKLVEFSYAKTKKFGQEFEAIRKDVIEIINFWFILIYEILQHKVFISYYVFVFH